MNLLKQIEQEQIEKLTAAKEIPDFAPGDTVIVNVKVVEGERSRVPSRSASPHPHGAGGSGSAPSFTPYAPPVPEVSRSSSPSTSAAPPIAWSRSSTVTVPSMPSARTSETYG